MNNKFIYSIDEKDYMKIRQTKSNIFKDEKYFLHEWIPEKSFLLHRKEEIKRIIEELNPLINGKLQNNILIYGKPGTGKTVILKFLIKEILNVNKNIEVFYFSCTSFGGHELYLLREISTMLNLKYFGTELSKYYRLLKEYTIKRNKSIVLILDEIDNMIVKSGGDFLYRVLELRKELFNINNKLGFSMIGITNNPSIMDGLDPRVKSRFGERNILFSPYNALQLIDILKKRVEKGFKKESVNVGVIEKCAALAAQEHGDARRAIELLKTAANIAENNNKKEINLKDVNMAEEFIDSDKIIKLMKVQPKQSQLVLLTVLRSEELTKKEGNIETNYLYLKYLELAKNTGISQLSQRRFSDLLSELEMMSIISIKLFSLGRYGRRKTVRIELSDSIKEKLKQILNEIF